VGKAAFSSVFDELFYVVRSCLPVAPGVAVVVTK